MCTLSAIVELGNEPELPVISNEWFPKTVEFPASKERAKRLVVDVDVGESDAVTPKGKFETLRLTLPLKPLKSTTDTTDVAVPPGKVRSSEEGAALRTKPGDRAMTLRLIVVVAV